MEKTPNFSSQSIFDTTKRYNHEQLVLRWLTILAIALLAHTQMNVYPTKAQVSSEVDAAQASPDVYYGRPANPEEAAFSVWFYSGENKKCSGIILSDQVISTALHCLKGNNKQIFDLTKEDVYVFLAGDESHPPLKVKEIREIGSKTPFNDRALLLLQRPITFSKTVKPIKMGKNEMKYKDGLFAIGHGLSESASFSRNPRVGKQILKEGSTVCTAPSFIITKNVDSSNEAVITNGDSGGGLFVHIPANDPDFDEGYYLLGTTTSFCSFDLYDDNGKVNPYYEMGFQSLFFDDIQAEIKQATEDVSLWPAPRKYFFPSIKNELSKTLLPTIKMN